MQYIKNFTKERSSKIGASDISKLIQHPEKSESLYGYSETALTLWQEKTGRIKKEPAGFSAEMGNTLEPVVLRKFISENIDKETAQKFYSGYMLCELNKTEDGYPDAENYQNTNFLHHTKAENDFAVAHADCLHLLNIAGNHAELIEAKTALSAASKRRDDIYSGYDTSLKNHQGIPLKHFYQVQFQAAIYQEVYGLNINTGFLALIFTDGFKPVSFHQWEIRIDRKIQERLLELASYMKKCIDTDTPPKMLAMNQDDIKIMYPKLDEDFRIISGDELQVALHAIEQRKLASEQEKAWKRKKEDADNTLSIFLKDAKTIKGIIGDEIVNLATWQERKGAERVAGLKEIKQYPEIEKLLREKNLINKSENTRSVVIKYKE
ncbi:MAG TPA: hypothetical protein DCS12_11345 [Clostridiales bacterium]|nr:hypothetical protein [Clostridiales bacterium]